MAQKIGMHTVTAHVVSNLPLEGQTPFDQVTDLEKERKVRAHSRTVEAMVKAAKQSANEEE